MRLTFTVFALFHFFAFLNRRNYEKIVLVFDASKKKSLVKTLKKIRIQKINMWSFVDAIRQNLDEVAGLAKDNSNNSRGGTGAGR